MTDIYLNSRLIGSCSKAESFVEKFRFSRRQGHFPEEMNITYNEGEDKIELILEKGRARRPLIIVENGKSLLTKQLVGKIQNNEITWKELVSQGVIEYLDSSEEEDAYIAISEEELTKEHTHLEISPLVILGAQSAMVPYSHNNRSTRVLIGAKTLKQGLGIYALNYLMRLDTDVSILHYSQRPIVKTVMYDFVDYENHPIGQNVVVAVIANRGYNIEDAIVMSQGSVQRGLYRSTYFRPYKTEELKYAGGQQDDICVPDKDIRGYRTEDAYKYLESDGIIAPEIRIKEDDVLVGKTSPPRFLVSLGEFKIGVEERRESSVALKHGEEGVVGAVLLTESEEGNKYIKIRVRDQRIPELGDKFASRHGQKGVIGLLVPQEDMPFSASGIVPDIIFSPHSLPSRMTMGHMLELLAGKVGSLSGRQVDGTAFSAETETDLRKSLKKMGFKDNGEETLYNGITGEQYNARIFVGSIYYLKLRHMVSNKIHSRARGPVQLLTRQPTEGRSKEGGLRLGEMEKDCFVAHGSALLLHERFSSDKDVIPICKKCGLVAVYNRFKDKTLCPMCGENAPVSFVEMSYAFKLLLDELKSLCIYPKINIGKKV